MAEPVWDDEAGEWVYPEDDGSEEPEDTPGEALWRQKQQDARDRDIRRRNALAGNRKSPSTCSAICHRRHSC